MGRIAKSKAHFLGNRKEADVHGREENNKAKISIDETHENRGNLFPAHPNEKPIVDEEENGQRQHRNHDIQELIEENLTSDRKSTRLNSSHQIISYAVF